MKKSGSIKNLLEITLNMSARILLMKQDQSTTKVKKM